MVAAATISFESAKAERARLWTPSECDELAYEWVTFEGKSQRQVATDLQISQAAVSRIVQRYNRWLAHAGPGIDDAPRRMLRWRNHPPPPIHHPP